jgi:hypothetical protein
LNTVLVWLLITVPINDSSYANQPHAHVIERFADQAECQRVGVVLRTPVDVSDGGPRLQLRCVQARIVATQEAVDVR